MNKTKQEHNILNDDIENQTGDDIEDFLKTIPGVTFE